MKKLHVLCAALALTFVPMGAMASEQDQVNDAATIMQRFKALPEKGIPRAILRDAKGFAILTVAKGAFGVSGKIGQGVVVARTADGWSGPSFVQTGGVGFGAQIGGQVTEFVLVLNTQAAVRAFEHGGNIQLGGELSVAAGPIGRTAGGDVMPKAAIYTYSRSKGLFAGASLEGAIIKTNEDANRRYYGRPVTARAILNHRVAPPSGAATLRRTL